MIKARSKKLSILLVLAMLMTMFVGLGTAGAASSYSVGQPMNVVVGSNDGYINTLNINVTAGSVSGDAYARLELPSGFKVKIASGVADKFGAGTEIGVRVQDDDGNWETWKDFEANGNPETLNLTGRVFELRIQGASSLTDDGKIAFRLEDLYVDAGFSGEVKMNIEAYPGSGLSSGEVIIAKAGAGAVSLSMGDVNTITTSKTDIDKLYITEDSPGALGTSGSGLKLKLPSGFTWVGYTSASKNVIWGQSGATLNLSTEDDGRTLVITTSSKTTKATKFEIKGLGVKVDESVAKLGDVVATVGGKTSSTVSELLVAKYGEYKVIVEPVGDAKQVVAGKKDQEIGAFRIKEGIAGSLVANRTITLEIIGNAKWEDVPVLDGTKSKNHNLGSWEPVGTTGKIIRATVNSASTSAADMVFHKAELSVAASAALDGEIKIKAYGTAGLEETTITVAKVVPPVVGSVDKPADVKIGVADQKLPAIIITETQKEAISAKTGENQLMLVFPQGVVPKVGTMTVEVLEGDMTVDISSRGVNKLSDGRWYAFVNVKSTSMKPAKIKFDNLYATVDRTVAEGPITVAITGSAVNITYANGTFPGDLAVGGVTVANAITPAPDASTSGQFKIGSNIYYVGNAAKVMDVAPYVKNGRTYVPMRYLGEILGAEVVWNDAARTVTLTKGSDVVVFTIGSTTYTVNGETKAADVAPEIVSSRTMLPARFVAEAFGAQVGWDAATKTVLIQK